MPPLDEAEIFAPSASADMPHDLDLAQLRLPQFSMESESSVLGGLLLDNNAWDRVGDLLTEGDFYRHEHRLIFMAVSKLVNDSKPADVITVFEHLQAQGKAQEVGGIVYLNQLAQYVPSATNIRRYAEIVREKAILRKLLTASDEIATQAQNPQGKPVERILDEAEQKIFAIGEEGSRMKQGFQSLDTLVVDLLDRVQEMADNPMDVTGVPTGFADLDRMTSGLQAGDLVVLAARPSMGKTSFAVNIAEHVALHEQLPVAIFSMEMGAAQLAVRIVGSIGRVNQGNLRTGKLSDEEWPRLTEAIERLRTVSLHIDETPGLTPTELRANARRLARAIEIVGGFIANSQALKAAAPILLEEELVKKGTEVNRVIDALIEPGFARAVVRFGKSARAEEVWQDVRDGIRRNVSVGYLLHRAVLAEERDGLETYRVTDWEPLEVSLVTIPADPGVGVGRARQIPAGQGVGVKTNPDKEETKMDEKEIQKRIDDARKQGGDDHGAD